MINGHGKGGKGDNGSAICLRLRDSEEARAPPSGRPGPHPALGLLLRPNMDVRPLALPGGSSRDDEHIYLVMAKFVGGIEWPWKPGSAGLEIENPRGYRGESRGA